MAARFVSGVGFPLDAQGGTEGIPFLKVSDLDDSAGPVLTAANYIDEQAQRGLRANVVPPGSLLLPKIGAAIASRERRVTVGVRSAFDNNVLAIVPQRVDERYLRYWLRPMRLDPYVNPGALPSLNVAALGRQSVPLTDRGVQREVADFLDQEWERINNARTRLERTIVTVDEYEAARTQDLVTRGVDRVEPVREVDLAWASHARPDWELRKLKTLVRMRSGVGITAEQLSDEAAYPVYGGNGVRGRCDDFTHEGRFLLVGRQGALCGNVHEASGRFWASEHAVVVSPLVDLDLSWLKGLLTAMKLNQFSEAAAQPGLAVERILNLRVPVPKRVEQKAIGNALNALSATDMVRRHANRLSTAMLAYRDAVTVEVVAGKMSTTRASQRQMEERLHAAAEGRLDEVAV